MRGYSRANPVLTLTILVIFGASALVSSTLSSLGVDTGPLIDGPQYDVELLFQCVLFPLLGLGLAGTLFLLNRYGRGDDDTDVSDIY